MDQSGIMCKKEETVFSSVPQPSYLTEDRLTPHPASSWLGKGRKRRALIWGITSMVLSAIGLIGLAMFEQYNGMLSELRSDLKHFNETSAEYVKRDKLQKCYERMRECTKEIAASSEKRLHLEDELKASQRAREEMTSEIQRMRERLAYLEGMKMAKPVDGTPSVLQGPKMH